MQNFATVFRAVSEEIATFNYSTVARVLLEAAGLDSCSYDTLYHSLRNDSATVEYGNLGNCSLQCSADPNIIYQLQWNTTNFSRNGSGVLIKYVALGIHARNVSETAEYRAMSERYSDYKVVHEFSITAKNTTLSDR